MLSGLWCFAYEQRFKVSKRQVVSRTRRRFT
nr:MAG TPA: hypothetical protein [Caudoviricetes sp.]